MNPTTKPSTEAIPDSEHVASDVVSQDSALPAPHFDPQQFARQFVQEQLSGATIRPPRKRETSPRESAPPETVDPDSTGAFSSVESTRTETPEPSSQDNAVNRVESNAEVSTTPEWVELGVLPDEINVVEITQAAPAAQKSATNKPKPREKHPAEGQTEDPECSNLDLEFRPQIHIAGFNSALNRANQVQTTSIPLFGKSLSTTKWTPFWGKLATFGLTFPEGFEFLPSKPEKQPSDGNGDGSAGQGPTKEELLALLAPGAVVEGEAPPPEPPPPEKKTRLKPPHDAVSIEDRLFYLLQPPLETWLKGQELIMPFEPFPYQYEGIAWLFAQQAALLADEMGLGKTMQTITAMRLLLRSGQVNRILLVCPKPLIPNWQREFKSWAEELPVVTIEGDAAHRKMQWTMPGVPILLANYEILTRDFEMLADDPPRFDLLVLDEAQRIKNRTSRTALTARAIPRKRSWALTGTPIENRPEEMASLYEFMEVIPQAANPDLRQLQKLSKSYVLRRTKDLVMKDLPPRFDREEYLELAPAQKAAYETAEKEGVIQLNELGDSISVQHVFELVLRLKQITNFEPVTGESAKLDRLEADMEEIAASGGKAILFSQWTKTIGYLQEKLARFDPLVYHGGIPVKKREPVLKEFKDNPSRSLLMMSYATGAVGLNLQFAGYVFLFDRWWNPAVEDQAINRAHRIGQKTQVIVTKFISKDTIEERIDKVLAEKRELFAAVLGDSDNTNVSLSLNASEIFGLFDLKARHGKGTRSIAPPPPPS
jgi:superfamily II DNA or RNA helicase